MSEMIREMLDNFAKDILTFCLFASVIGPWLVGLYVIGNLVLEYIKNS